MCRFPWGRISATCAGACFTNDFLLAIQIRLKLRKCCNSIAGPQIATNFCTCHNSTAVVPCKKFYSDHFVRIEVRVKQNLHRIWNAMEKTLVKQGLVLPTVRSWDQLCLIYVPMSGSCFTHSFVVSDSHQVQPHLVYNRPKIQHFNSFHFRYDAKIEAEIAAYNPFGRGGGGAPMKDTEGNVMGRWNHVITDHSPV